MRGGFDLFFMSTNNNKSNSKKIIHLKKSDKLKGSGLVTNSVYYIDTHDIKISLNHVASTDIIFTIDCKQWQNNLRAYPKSSLQFLSIWYNRFIRQS